MPRKEKLGTLRGVGQWKRLESAGDVRRFLAWCIHSVRDQSLEPKTAAILGQLGSFLLKAVETADLEARMARLEHALDADEHQPGNQTGTH